MSPPAPDICEQAFRAFIRTYGLFRGCMEPYFARFGISGAQWGVLRTLQRAEDEGRHGLRLTDLGQRLLVKPPSVTTLVDRLERLGLVARSSDTVDQRAKQVTLTAEGSKLLKRVLAEHPRQMHLVLDGLSAGEQAQLHKLMQRLGSHLEALAAGPEGRGPRTHASPRKPRHAPTLAARGDRL